MVKNRIPETDEGIQGAASCIQYDEMQRAFRDKGWLKTGDIIGAGIGEGLCLEIGPGPGYLGLEWLAQTHDTRLIGLEISPAMIAQAEKNAAIYGLSDRVSYEIGDVHSLPFADERFTGVFSNGSLHEWQDPGRAFAEITRVLQPKGIMFISDLKRNINPLLRAFMKATTRPKEIAPFFISSVNAAYTKNEMEEILSASWQGHFAVRENPMGVVIIAVKPK